MKVKGTLHWVSAPHAFTAEVRLYDNLFSEIEPDKIEIPGSLNPQFPRSADRTANSNPV